MPEKESQIEGFAIIDGAGIVHRFAVPEGAGWLVLPAGSMEIGHFDDFFWDRGKPELVRMATAELDAVKGRRHSFVPVGGE